MENIRLSNITLAMLPENAPDKRATHAMSIEHVRGLRVRDLAVRWSDEREPKWESALVMRRVSDFVVDGFDGRQGIPGTDRPAIVLDRVEGGTIVHARGSAGCRRLVHVRGDATRDVTLRDCRAPAGGTVVSFEDDSLRKAVRIS